MEIDFFFRASYRGTGMQFYVLYNRLRRRVEYPAGYCTSTVERFTVQSEKKDYGRRISRMEYNYCNPVQNLANADYIDEWNARSQYASGRNKTII
jgi:hypothetical protein